MKNQFALAGVLPPLDRLAVLVGQAQKATGSRMKSSRRTECLEIGPPSRSRRCWAACVAPPGRVTDLFCRPERFERGDSISFVMFRFCRADSSSKTAVGENRVATRQGHADQPPDESNLQAIIGRFRVRDRQPVK